MPPPCTSDTSDEERAALKQAHATQVDSALARLDAGHAAADAALDDDADDARAAVAVRLAQTLCFFVFFRFGGRAATSAYGIWRCTTAREADAIAEKRSHAGYVTRTYSMMGVSRDAVKDQALLLAATARTKGKVAAPTGVNEGPDGASGQARSPARSREADEASDGGAGAGMDDEAFASPQRKKQKKAAPKGPLTTPAAGGLFTPAPAEAPAPASAPHLALPAAHTAAQPPGAEARGGAARNAVAQRVEALEEELLKTKRKLSRMARRCEALERAQEAQHAAFEALRGGLGEALKAAAECVTNAALDAAPGAA